MTAFLGFFRQEDALEVESDFMANLAEKLGGIRILKGVCYTQYCCIFSFCGCTTRIRHGTKLQTVDGELKKIVDSEFPGRKKSINSIRLKRAVLH